MVNTHINDIENIYNMFVKNCSLFTIVINILQAFFIMFCFKQGKHEPILYSAIEFASSANVVKEIIQYYFKKSPGLPF